MMKLMPPLRRVLAPLIALPMLLAGCISNPIVTERIDPVARGIE